MTTYYKGNNIGLSYDAAAGTWSFNNTPQDFIDPNAFSTPDPKFPTAPTTPTTPTEPEQDPCPAGYIYDNSLKQCVPDPNYQNPFAQQEQQNNTTEAEKQQRVQIAGTDRFTSDNNFIATDEEYANMSAQELIENLKQRGFVNKNKETGQLEVDLNRGSMVAGFLDSQLARFGQEENTQLNKKKNIIGLLVNKGIIDSTTAYPRGGMSATGDGSDIPSKIKIPTITLGQAKLQRTVPNLVVDGYGGSVFGINLPSNRPNQFGDITKDFNASINNFANNFATAYITNPNFNPQGTIGTSESADKFDDIEQSKRREAKAKARKAEAEAFAKEQETFQNRKDMQQKIKDAEQQQKQQQEQQQSNERDRVRNEYKERGTVTYNTKDTGGYVTTPNTSQNKPPSERSGYTGSSNRPTPRTGPNLRTR